MAYQGPQGYPGQGPQGGYPGQGQGPQGQGPQGQGPQGQGPQGHPPGQAPQGYPAQGQAPSGYGYADQTQAAPGYGQNAPGYAAQNVQGYAGQGQPGYAANPSLYSEWGTRVAASLIDSAPIIAGWIVFFILASIVGNAFFSLFLYFLLFVGSLGWGIYNRWINGGAGQSLGKQKMNIKLVSQDTGQPIGTGQAFLRDLCHVCDGFFMIGYLFPLWDPMRQTFADKIMKTVVVPANQ